LAFAVITEQVAEDSKVKHTNITTFTKKIQRKFKENSKKKYILYDNEYTSFIDIYFYEYFLLSASAAKHFRHPVRHFS
jgi:hypothetical protein